jgi:Gpi18-like mannosyltransferase
MILSPQRDENVPYEPRNMQRDPHESARTIDPRGSIAWYVAGICLLVASILIRLSWYPVIVSDYTYFGKPWFDTLQSHAGLTAFAQPFADYAPAYLYLLKLLTFLPIGSLGSEKTLSLIFDVLIAYAGYRILKRITDLSKGVRFLAAAILFSLPTVMMNSSLWGQSDSLYSSMILMSLLAILLRAPLAASLAFGVAVSLKLQAIFFAPILVGYLLRSRETRLYLFVPPLVFLLSVLPAALGGGQFGYWLFIYLSQAHEYPWLSVSAQSIFAFLQPVPLTPLLTMIAFWAGVLAAVAVAAAVTVGVKKLPDLFPEQVVRLSLASTLLLPYLLPRMHERYFYLADILSVLYAFCRPRHWWVPLIVVFASLASYMPFLSGQVKFLSWAQVDLRMPALLLLPPVALVAYELVKGLKREDDDFRVRADAHGRPPGPRPA